MKKEVEAFCEGYVMAVGVLTFPNLARCVAVWAQRQKYDTGKAKGYALIWYNARMKRLGLA
jgi:hypothetical protein